MIDRIADYWDAIPCNSTDAEQAPDADVYFDETERKKYEEERHIKPFAQFAQWKGKKVLEIGTGIGIDASNFARAGAFYTGIDLSQKSLELCKKRFTSYHLNGNFFHGSAEALSSIVPTEPYDLIYSFGVIHHTSCPQRVIEELKKYCGPNTEVRIMLYARWSWKVLRIVLVPGRGAFWKRDELVKKYSEGQQDCPVIYTYTFREVRKLLRGFTITSMRKEYLSLFGIEKDLISHLPTFFTKILERILGWNILITGHISENTR